MATSIQSVHLHPSNVSVFCCPHTYPVNEIRTGIQQPLGDFGHTITRGPASPNPRLLRPNELHLIDDALYLIQYEKRFESQQVQQTRYFIKDPDLVDWLEIPTQVYLAENERRPFTHQDSYVKFACNHHHGYLFVCRVLVREEQVEKLAPYVKRTREPRDTDKDEDDDEQYKMFNFSKNWTSSSVWGNGKNQVKLGVMIQAQNGAPVGEPFGSYDG